MIYLFSLICVFVEFLFIFPLVSLFFGCLKTSSVYSALIQLQSVYLESPVRLGRVNANGPKISNSGPPDFGLALVEVNSAFV